MHLGMRGMRKVFCLFIGLLTLTDPGQAASEQDLRLVPFPKRLTLESGRFPL